MLNAIVSALNPRRIINADNQRVFFTGGYGGESIAVYVYLAMKTTTECDYEDYNGLRTANPPSWTVHEVYQQAAGLGWNVYFEAQGLT